MMFLQEDTGYYDAGLPASAEFRLPIKSVTYRTPRLGEHTRRNTTHESMPNSQCSSREERAGKRGMTAEQDEAHGQTF